MRLIDADALKIHDVSPCYGYYVDGVTDGDIEDAPTIDAVPVIRCNECKYYIADGCDECVLMRAKSIIAGINNKRWFSDFYCAWGERKEE